MTESNSWGGGLTRRQLNDPASTAEANSWGGGLTRAQKNTPAADTEANTWGGRLTRAQLATPGADTEANTWGGPITLAQWQNPGVISEANSWGGRLTRLQLNSIASAFSPATVAWLAAVELADGAPLEPAVYAAMGTFAEYRIPLGGACCLMAGARTLAGALVPMVGAAPTEVNFVTGDYDRTTGLKGDGIGKYLDSNRSQTADPQNNHHLAVQITTTGTGIVVGTRAEPTAGFGDNLLFFEAAASWPFRSRISIFDTPAQGTRSTVGATGLLAMSRSSSSSFISRLSSANETVVSTSTAALTGNLSVFARIRTDTTSVDSYTNARLSMYSIGPSVDLAAMDTAITTAMDAIDRAINPLRYAILDAFTTATRNYLLAVEAADGQQLENTVLAAMGSFAEYRIPLGGACCLMAGARTLAGALVPMVGAPPTEVNFVNGDYNRVTGLKGDGIGKYLDSNRAGDADPQDSKHLAVFATTFHSRNVTRAVIGNFPASGSSQLITAEAPARIFFRNNYINAALALASSASPTGLWGSTRSSSAGYTGRIGGSSNSYTDTSASPTSGNITVFARSAADFSDARLSYYSIGPSVDLTAMDTAITTCMSSLAAAGI